MINLNELPQRLRLTKASDEHVAFDESFLAPGMLVNLIAVNRYSNYDDPHNPDVSRCFELVLDADSYYDFNLKLMPEVYYPNIHTPKDTRRSLFTAVEAGCYSPQEKAFFYVSRDGNDPMGELLTQLGDLFDADVPDALATKVATSRLLASHQRLREALQTVLGNEDNLMLRDLLDEAEHAEQAMPHGLG